MFESLTREQLGSIVEMQLARLNERLAERGFLALELTDGARELIAETGWDPAYGARPLKRAIQRLLENPLALHCSRASSGRARRSTRTELGEIRFVRAGEDGTGDSEAELSGGGSAPSRSRPDATEPGARPPPHPPASARPGAAPRTDAPRRSARPGWR